MVSDYNIKTLSSIDNFTARIGVASNTAIANGTNLTQDFDVRRLSKFTLLLQATGALTISVLLSPDATNWYPWSAPDGTKEQFALSTTNKVAISLTETHAKEGEVWLVAPYMRIEIANSSGASVTLTDGFLCGRE